MKIYSKSTTKNKTEVNLLPITKKIENNLQLKKFVNDSINQLFSEEKATKKNKDNVLTLKQKPYALRYILKSLKSNDNVDRKLDTSINLLIRNVNSFISTIKQEKINEEGKVINFVPTSEYEEILKGLMLFTLSSSFNKAIALTKQKGTINIYKKDES